LNEGVDELLIMRWSRGCRSLSCIPH
jgi:hypothetical protein